MGRAFALLFPFALLNLFALWLNKQGLIAIDWGSYFLSVLVCAITGKIYFKITGWQRTTARPGRRQVVEIETRETPEEITNAAFWATLRLGGFGLFGIVGLFSLVGALPFGIAGFLVCIVFVTFLVVT